MTTDNLGELAERLRHLARVPTLLVACDYDGTLAPLTDHPMEAYPNRDAVAAMRSLAELANTHVTVISGRSLRDLATLSRLPEEIRLIGSHGSEFDLGFASELDSPLALLRRQVVDEVRQLGEKYGAILEEKPTGVTFHFRSMDDDAAEAARQELVRGPASRDGVFVRNGNHILELSVVDTNKGEALESSRRRVGASAVVFIGDDNTDEDAFRTLSGPDVGVKVGEARTLAEYRVADPDRVAQLLALLAELRGRWLRGEGLTPIEDHSILSDLRTAAIVAPDSAITWLCVPRIDSAAVFASLLGGRASGHFTIRAGERGDPPVGQRYLDRSLVLETEFADFTVTDFLDTSGGRTHRLAKRSNLVRLLEGSGRVIVEFAPRLDFGRVPTRLQVRPDGLVVHGTSDLLVLRAPDVAWELTQDGPHQTAIGQVELVPGQVVTLELRSGTGSTRADTRADVDRYDDTNRFWTDWAAGLQTPSLERELVIRSALTLKSLCHGPTGAIVAAATTSLPESLGGVRNWDHRYCWLRHAALAATALARIDSHGEGLAFLDWVLNLLETRTDAARLAPLYNVTGRHLPPEAEIADLPGYGGSRPVRVGNAAEGQVQLDVFGPVVDLVHVLMERGEALSAEHWRLVETMVLAVAGRWEEPDHGIWELRKPTRHNVYSKVMCWVAVDRAIRVADQFLDRAPGAWVDLRSQIRADVLEYGWNASVGSFTTAYNSDQLDASVLAVGLSGLLPASDERFTATVNAIDRELRSGPTVRRYLEDDGLPGKEGGYSLMTSWLVDSLCLIGDYERAGNLFKDLCTLAGHTGLLAGSFDPESGRALGNVPQAYSHLGLINNALALDGNL